MFVYNRSLICTSQQVSFLSCGGCACWVQGPKCRPLQVLERGKHLFYFIFILKSKNSINGVFKRKINQSQNWRPWQRSNVFFSIPKRAKSKKLKSQTFPFLCVKKELVNLETQHFLDKKHLWRHFVENFHSRGSTFSEVLITVLKWCGCCWIISHPVLLETTWCIYRDMDRIGPRVFVSS